MRALIITLMEHGKPTPVRAAKICMNSIADTGTDLTPEIFKATTPKTNTEDMIATFGKKVKWDWPMDESKNCWDFSSGLFKKNYPARDQSRVIACAVSHARAWKECVDSQEEMVILEQDAKFTRKFEPSIFEGWKWGAIGLNDPRGATRKAGSYYKLMMEDGRHIQPVPNVDKELTDHLPLGLAGNSAYIIRPELAKQLLERIEEKGMWPNDALMCKQLFPSIRVCYPFYTTVQQLGSTTTRL